MTNVYVTSGYVSGQQKYFTSLRTAGAATSRHSAFGKNFAVFGKEIEGQYLN